MWIFQLPFKPCGFVSALHVLHCNQFPGFIFLSWFNTSFVMKNKSIFYVSCLPDIYSSIQVTSYCINKVHWSDALTPSRPEAIPSLIVIPFWANCCSTSLLIHAIASVDNRLRNREKVEWSASGPEGPTPRRGDDASSGRPKNFLNDLRSLIWFSSSGSEGIPSSPEVFQAGGETTSVTISLWATSTEDRRWLLLLRFQPGGFHAGGSANVIIVL